MSRSQSLTGDTPFKKSTHATGLFINGSSKLEEQKLGPVLGEVDVDFMLDVMPNSGVNLNLELERTVPKWLLPMNVLIV